ncbi:MAG: YkoF family thiamine/hydroxymethylpyrimidine-binding protein [Pseudomonadota bacterium]
MQARAEISFYPLRENYIAPIKGVIEHLNTYEDLAVVTNPMSTQVTGDYDALMHALTTVCRRAFEQHGKSIFVFKLLPL